MAECVRCNDFTDNRRQGDYIYCDDCLDRFNNIEQNGVVVTDTENGDVQITVTADDGSVDGGIEQSQADGLARGKYIMDETGLKGVFKYERSGSVWILDEYLQAHPKIRQQVNRRLSRVPERSDEGLLNRIREIL
jgi:hypothetical protein